MYTGGYSDRVRNSVGIDINLFVTSPSDCLRCRPERTTGKEDTSCSDQGFCIHCAIYPYVPCIRVSVLMVIAGNLHRVFKL